MKLFNLNVTILNPSASLQYYIMTPLNKKLKIKYTFEVQHDIEQTRLNARSGAG